MNDKFDELAKHMAQAVTRRQALRRFGVGVGAFLLAALALPRRANATKGGNNGKDIVNGYCGIDTTTGTLTGWCYNCNSVGNGPSPDCSFGASASVSSKCGGSSVSSTRCKFVNGFK